MLNKSIIMGRLTADPELKQTANGVSVTSFSIATPRNFASKGEERVTDFLDIVAWRGTADFVCRNFSKGQAIIVEGSIHTRSYVDKQDINRRVWEIIADAVYFAEKNPAAADASAPAGSGGAEDAGDINEDGALPS